MNTPNEIAEKIKDINKQIKISTSNIERSEEELKKNQKSEQHYAVVLEQRKKMGWLWSAGIAVSVLNAVFSIAFIGVSPWLFAGSLALNVLMFSGNIYGFKKEYKIIKDIKNKLNSVSNAKKENILSIQRETSNIQQLETSKKEYTLKHCELLFKTPDNLTNQGANVLPKEQNKNENIVEKHREMAK